MRLASYVGRQQGVSGIGARGDPDGAAALSHAPVKGNATRLRNASGDSGPIGAGGFGEQAIAGSTAFNPDMPPGLAGTIAGHLPFALNVGEQPTVGSWATVETGAPGGAGSITFGQGENDVA